MSKLDELIEELCPAGVQYKKLNEIAHYAKKRIDVTEIDKNTYVGTEILDDSICIKSTLKEEQIEQMDNVVDTIVKSLKI